jgi:hypothetical protein
MSYASVTEIIFTEFLALIIEGQIVPYGERSAIRKAGPPRFPHLFGGAQPILQSQPLDP